MKACSGQLIQTVILFALVSCLPAWADDPFEDILDRAVEALDESYDNWKFRGEETVDSTTFTINYAASISTDGQRRLDRVLILHADPDRDRQVTREEAIRFLEIQLGIRWVTGDRLRRDDGQVIDFAEFIRTDANQDNEISRSEFIDNGWNSSTANEDFDGLDGNADERITLNEFSKPDGPYLRNPSAMFDAADTDQNRRLSHHELQNSIPKERQYLIPSNLIAFDKDGDGGLSLDEFRISMLGTYNCSWENVPKDENRDQKLSFDEFKFDARNLFGLQRRFYFHRLDANGDQSLSVDEFEFRKHKVHSLYRVSMDGEDSRELYRHEDFPFVGSPDVSADGQWVLFEGTPAEGTNRTQILLMRSDGADVRDVCDGLMPSWSADGSQFACSRYEGGSSVWIMNMDGTASSRIDDGWAATWSPDGKSIAYTNDNSIRIYDVQTGKKRTLLAKGTHPYHYIFWNMSWSPDSRQIAFKGKLDSRHEIAIVQVGEPPHLRRRFATKEEMASDLAWSPDGRQLYFSMYSRQHLHSLVYQIDLESNDPPKVVPEANTSMSWSHLEISPDNQFMILSTSGAKKQ
ncbi:MAG: hypothetical protein P8L85_20135 [Rubripirellula sp.]|nr:hypothetical protein [Rubripirellula sp.]